MHQIFQSLPLVPIAFRPFFYAMAALALAFFVFGTADRMRIWTLGRDRPNTTLAGASGRRLLRLSLTKFLSRDCLLAARVFPRSRARGAMLLGIVWGSLILLAGVIISAVVYVSPVELVNYQLSRVLAFLMDLAGLALFAGLIAALVRRYFFHPDKWVKVSGDGFMLLLFAWVVLLGFVMEGARLAGTGLAAATWYPVGSVAGIVLAVVAGSPSAAIGLYSLLYLIHAGSALALIAYIPFSRLFHVFASQITAFAARAELEQHSRSAVRRVPEPAASPSDVQ